MATKALKEKAVAKRKSPNNSRPRYYSAMLLSKLKPYKKNPRQNDDAVEAVVKSIEQFGKIAPIICNEKLQICAGHTRFKAAIERNEKTFPVVVVPGLTGERFKAYNIVDNQTASIAQWDTPALAEIIKELQDEGFPTETLGFAEDQLDEIMASIEDRFKGETDPDDVPEPPTKAISRMGDLWLLGKHRLLCGDATKPEDVERLMDGDKSLSMIIDPPYGMRLDPDYSKMPASKKAIGFGRVPGKKHRRVIGDDIDFDASKVILPTNVAEQFWFGADYYIGSITDTEHEGSWLVWDKRTEESTDAGLGSCFELIWSHNKHRRLILRHKWFGFITEKGTSRTFMHPTEKSTALIADIITRWIKGNIYDPFLGSGTTIIAAEKLNRKCYGMEIEPIYVDVSVRRWQNFTGKKAVLNRNGKQSKITMPVPEGVPA